MTAPYGFGFAQEDDRTEARVLRPARGRRVLCVGSGGEVPLGMVARGATVDAVDSDPAQLHLVAIKHAAVCTLDPEDAAPFLGYADHFPPTGGDVRARRLVMYRSVRSALSPDAGAFWDRRSDILQGGVVWAGRFERYLRGLMAGLRPAWGRAAIEALCSASTLDDQARIFDERIGRPWLRGVFRLAFHPAAYRRGGIAAQALAQRASAVPLGEQYFASFRAFCTATPASDNWFLAFTLRGGLADIDAGPDFLRRTGAAVLREDPARLQLHQTELRGWLGETDQRYTAFHLSNVGDWLDEAAFGALLRAVVDRAEPGADLLWRELQVERHVPEALQDRLVVDRAHGEQLRAGDRFPFYRLVPGRVVDA